METNQTNPTDIEPGIVDVVDDLTGVTVPAVEQCPACFAGPFAGETVAAAWANYGQHAARCQTNPTDIEPGTVVQIAGTTHLPDGPEPYGVVGAVTGVHRDTGRLVVETWRGRHVVNPTETVTVLSFDDAEAAGRDGSGRGLY